MRGSERRSACRGWTDLVVLKDGLDRSAVAIVRARSSEVFVMLQATMFRPVGARRCTHDC